MTQEEMLAVLRRSPLIASVQAGPDSPLADIETLLRLARASLDEGVRVLRLEGAETIARLRAATGAPVIGLIKREYPGSPVYITPTLDEVEQLLATGCEAIAIDATDRPRPGGATRERLIARIREAGRLVVADGDAAALAHFREATVKPDFFATTLSGYTDPLAGAFDPPDLAPIQAGADLPIIAEGRFADPAQARLAVARGAVAVTIGGALNDPVKQTRRFLEAVRPADGPVAAFDLGGTWIRYGLFAPDGTMRDHERAPMPSTRAERLAWMRERVGRSEAVRVGIGAGGVIDPRTGEVTAAKPIIPDHVGTRFREVAPDRPVIALNDGHATAWVHGLRTAGAATRVATLALGTGVGAGMVIDGRLLMGSGGEAPGLNDVPAADGRTFEEIVGGRALGGDPDPETRGAAVRAVRDLIAFATNVLLAERVVLAGSVGLSSWLREGVADLPIVTLSPYGVDAGLVGAACLAQFPPPGIVH